MLAEDGKLEVAGTVSVVTVDDQPAVTLDQAENGMYTVKAVMIATIPRLPS